MLLLGAFLALPILNDEVGLLRPVVRLAPFDELATLEVEPQPIIYQLTPNARPVVVLKFKRLDGLPSPGGKGRG